MTHKFYIDLGRVSREKVRQKERMQEILMPIMKGTIHPSLVLEKDWSRNRSFIDNTCKRFQAIHQQMSRSFSPSSMQDSKTDVDARRTSIMKEDRFQVDGSLPRDKKSSLDGRFTFNDSRGFRRRSLKAAFRLPDISADELKSDRIENHSLTNLVVPKKSQRQEQRLAESSPKVTTTTNLPMKTSTLLPIITKEHLEEADESSGQAKRNISILKAKLRGVGFFMKKSRRDPGVMAGASQYSCILPTKVCRENQDDRDGYYLAADMHKSQMQNFNDYYGDPKRKPAFKEKLATKVKNVMKMVKENPQLRAMINPIQESMEVSSVGYTDLVLEFAKLHGIPLDEVDIESEMFLQMVAYLHAAASAARLHQAARDPGKFEAEHGQTDPHATVQS